MIVSVTKIITNNTNNFYGEVTGVQIQQGTVNSSQSQSVNQGFDYAEVAEIIEKIKKYDSFLDDEYGENALEIRNKIDEIEYLVQKKENPSRIKTLLSDIKSSKFGFKECKTEFELIAIITFECPVDAMQTGHFEFKSSLLIPSASVSFCTICQENGSPILISP